MFFFFLKAYHHGTTNKKKIWRLPKLLKEIKAPVQNFPNKNSRSGCLSWWTPPNFKERNITNLTQTLTKKGKNLLTHFIKPEKPWHQNLLRKLCKKWKLSRSLLNTEAKSLNCLLANQIKHYLHRTVHRQVCLIPGMQFGFNIWKPIN